MNDILANSVYFGMALSLGSYWIGHLIHKKYSNPLLNPLLIASGFIIIVLLVGNIEYETYEKGASFLSYLLTPATVCLAVPLYRQTQILKDNLKAVLISILCGCIAHGLIIIMIAMIGNLDQTLMYSILPKSVTTAIAVSVSNEIKGIASITIIGVVVAGMSGAVFAPKILKIFKITEPVAQGLAIGTASHALGTTKAVELGEVQGAMSSLAIVVTGILTVIIVPIIVQLT